MLGLKFVFSVSLVLSPIQSVYAKSNLTSAPSKLLLRVLNKKSQKIQLKDLKSLRGLIGKTNLKYLAKGSHSYSRKIFKVYRDNDDIIVEDEKSEMSIRLKLSFGKDVIYTHFDGQKFDLSKKSNVSKILKKIRSKYRPSSSARNPSILSCGKSSILLSILLCSSSNAMAADDWFFLGGMAVLGIGIAIGLVMLGKSLSKTEHKVEVGDSQHDVNVQGIRDTAHTVEVNGVSDTQHTVSANSSLSLGGQGFESLDGVLQGVRGAISEGTEGLIPNAVKGSSGAIE